MSTTEVLKNKKSIRGLSARVTGSGKMPTPLKLKETAPSLPLPSPSFPSSAFSLSFASFGRDGGPTSSASTTAELPFSSTSSVLPSSPNPTKFKTTSAAETESAPSSRIKQGKILGIGFPSRPATKDEDQQDENDLPLPPPKRPGTFRARSSSFHALSLSFRANSISSSSDLPLLSAVVVPSTPLSLSFTPDDSPSLASPSASSLSIWTHRLSNKLRPRKSVPNLRARSPPPPFPATSQPPTLLPHSRRSAQPRSASASPQLLISSPIPPLNDPFAPPAPPPPPRQRSTSFAGAAAINAAPSNVGGGFKSPRLSPSMLDLALEARGLIQLDGRARKASEGGGGAGYSSSSSNGFGTPSTSSVPPSPLSISGKSTSTNNSSTTNYRTTSFSSSRNVSESPKPGSFSTSYSPHSPVPHSPLPPLPTDADWQPRPALSPELDPLPNMSEGECLEDGMATIRAASHGSGEGGGERGRGRRGWNDGVDGLGDTFGASGGGRGMPPGPNRPQRVENGGGPARGDGGDERKPDRPIAPLEDDSDSDSDTTSSSSSSSSSEDDDEEVAEGLELNRPPRASPRVEDNDDSDDDVPLAVAHPAALSVQKSLRLSRKKEKLEKKLKEKKLARGKPSPPSRKRDALTSESGTEPLTREGGGTMRRSEPRKEPPSAYGAGTEGVFVAEELERKLLAHLEGGGASLPSVRARKASSSGTKSRGEAGFDPNGGHSRSGAPGEATRARVMEKSRTLPLPPPPPPMDLQATTSSFGGFSLGRAKSQSQSSTRTRGASNQPIPSSSVVDRPAPRRRPSEPISSPFAPAPPLPLPASSNYFPLPPPRAKRPSLPHVITSNSSSAQHSNRPSPPRSPLPITTETTRIFLEKMGGRAVEIEVGRTTTAGMVLEGLRRKGELGGREGEEMMNGGWAVWEGGNDWGIERPLREYELLSEVSSSWNAETRLNAFIIKRCKISAMLTLPAVPNQPPNIIGWVQMEVKKGKWSKRFLEIREGSVWICKNDRGKDETFLCSMAAYDVYSFTRPYKAPKGRVWGLKSQDKIQFFEEPKDYIHIFTTSDDRSWETMWRGITSARSYSLTLSNPSLFRSHTHPSSLHSTPYPSSALSPSSTQLHHPPAAAPTLINPAALEFGVAPHGGLGVGLGGGVGVGGAPIGAIGTGNRGLFEKGSLLGKMHG